MRLDAAQQPLAGCGCHSPWDIPSHCASLRYGTKLHPPPYLACLPWLGGHRRTSSRTSSSRSPHSSWKTIRQWVCTGLQIKKRFCNVLRQREPSEFIIWWAVQDLNLWHLPCKGSALPTELTAHNFGFILSSLCVCQEQKILEQCHSLGENLQIRST